MAVGQAQLLPLGAWTPYSCAGGGTIRAPHQAWIPPGRSGGIEAEMERRSICG